MISVSCVVSWQPSWVLKTAKEKYVQRLIHLSADLARQLGTVLENYQNGTGTEVLLFLVLQMTPSANEIEGVDE